MKLANNFKNPNIKDHSYHLEGRNLMWTILLNLSITIIEFIGGILSNSIALISDAFHNLSDVLAIIIAWIANKISKRQTNHAKTFGYKRTEILAALINSFILVSVVVFLFFDAVSRLIEPGEIFAFPMLMVATFGLIGNFISVAILKKYVKHNLNMKAAYLHLLGDTLSSIAVIVGALLILIFDIYWIDPLIGILIGIYILKEVIVVLSETFNILMQASPKSIDFELINQEVVKIKEVNNIHHLHVWNLTDKEIHFEAHINLKSNCTIKEAEIVRKEIELLLQNNVGIQHVTLQMEYETCHDKKLIWDLHF